jgi:hypothetical protein
MDVEKNGGRLFRRPKLTLSCSAEGKEEIYYTSKIKDQILFNILFNTPQKRDISFIELALQLI